MNSKIILSISLLFWLQNQCAQNSNSEEITFLKEIGDLGNSRGVTVEQTKDNGYIITGHTTDGNHEGEDVLLIKTNPSGEVVWRKTFGGEGNDNGWAVRQTKDDGYIISGFTNSFGKGDMDIYLIKTDAKGELVWSKTFGGDGDEYGWDIRTTNDNGYIIASQTNSFGKGEIDAYLLKVDENGNELWSNTYGGDKIDRVFSIQETRDNGFVTAGITYSYDSDSPNDRDGYLLKVDAFGREQWHKIFGKDKYDVVHSVALTKDNGYVLTGYGESFAKRENNRDVYLIKTDKHGETKWLKTYGDIEAERGIKGLQTKDGGYIAIGFTDKLLNLYLVRTDNNGELLWKKAFGENNKLEFGYTVRETSDGGFILLGHSEDLETKKGKVLLIKTDSKGNISQKR